MGTSSARLPAPKIEVACTCGRTIKGRLGKLIRCKECGEKVRMVRDPAVSERSRGAILSELGIDPEAAARAYEAEVERRRAPTKNYTCSRCDGAIPREGLKGAYVKGELVCQECRASAEVIDRRAERGRIPAGRAAVEAAPGLGDSRKAFAAALLHGALFLVGIAGPLWALAHMRGLLAVAVGLAIAVPGALAVYRSRV